MMNNAFPILLSAGAILLFLYAVAVLFLRMGWKKTPDFIAQKNILFTTSVSVIVPARNEEKNIERCLNALLNQTYPISLFEIILVDDNSSDKTAALVKEFCARHPQLRLHYIAMPELTDAIAPKKRAIEKGVDLSIGELLLMTDADCWVGENWIQTIVSFYLETQAKLIVGPVIVQHDERFGILQAFEKLDFFSLVSSGASSLYYNKALLCNGANLAVDKKAYLRVIQETKGQGIASGDDMFLMLAIQAQFENGVRFIKAKDALVKTNAQPNFAALISQRKRWASKSFLYADAYLTLISVLVFLVHILLLFTGILCIFYFEHIALFLGLVLLKTLVDWIFLYPIATYFGELKMLKKIIPTELINIVFIPLIAIASFKKEYRWKARKLN